jgi:hypothetical protein
MAVVRLWSQGRIANQLAGGCPDVAKRGAIRFRVLVTEMLLVLGALQAIAPDRDSLISLESLQVLGLDMFAPQHGADDDHLPLLVCRPIHADNPSKRIRSEGQPVSFPLAAGTLTAKPGVASRWLVGRPLGRCEFRLTTSLCRLIC